MGQGNIKFTSSPVVGEAQAGEGVGRLYALVGHVVDGQDAAGVLVHAMPPEVAGQVGWDECSVPVIRQEQTALTIRISWSLSCPVQQEGFVMSSQQQSNILFIQ